MLHGRYVEVDNGYRKCGANIYPDGSRTIRIAKHDFGIGSYYIDMDMSKEMWEKFLSDSDEAEKILKEVFDGE